MFGIGVLEKKISDLQLNVYKLQEENKIFKENIVEHARCTGCGKTFHRIDMVRQCHDTNSIIDTGMFRYNHFNSTSGLKLQYDYKCEPCHLKDNLLKKCNCGKHYVSKKKGERIK